MAKRTSKVDRVSPSTALKPLTKTEEKLRAKAERAESARQSKAIAQALIVSKHERLSNALLLLQIMNKK